MRFAAVRAQGTHQPLGQHAVERGGQQEGFHAHIPQPGNGTDGGIGVQGGEHQVTGKTGLDGDLHRFQVTDLTDHHHVRVLTQDGPQPPGEGHVDLGIDLGLADAVQIVFDRVFHGEDVAAAVVQPHQRRVQSGGLARAGRAGDQYYAVGAADDPLHGVVVFSTHAQLAQLQPPGLLVQQAQHHPLAMPGWQGGNPHIHCPADQPQADAAVLGQALFGNVQLGHDLDPRDDHRCQRPGRLQHFTQDTVHPQADRQAILEGLDMDIRGVLLDRFGQQRVDQADDRRLVLGFQQVFRFGQRLGHRHQVGILTKAFDELHGIVGRALVTVAQPRSKGVVIQHDRAQRMTGQTPQLQQRLRITVGTDEHVQLIVAQLIRQHAEAPGEPVAGFCGLQPGVGQCRAHISAACGHFHRSRVWVVPG